MPTPGPLELVIILVIALLILGPGRLPDVGSALGKSLREFRKASSDIQDAVKIDTSPLPPDQAATTVPAAPPAAVAPVAAAPLAAAPAPAEAPAAAAPAAPPIPAPVAADAPVAAPPGEVAAVAPTSDASSDKTGAESAS
jgi:TatA/E family protein of Tat protein translocase